MRVAECLIAAAMAAVGAAAASDDFGRGECAVHVGGNYMSMGFASGKMPLADCQRSCLRMRSSTNQITHFDLQHQPKYNKWQCLCIDLSGSQTKVVEDHKCVPCPHPSNNLDLCGYADPAAKPFDDEKDYHVYRPIEAVAPQPPNNGAPLKDCKQAEACCGRALENAKDFCSMVKEYNACLVDTDHCNFINPFPQDPNCGANPNGDFVIQV